MREIVACTESRPALLQPALVGFATRCQLSPGTVEGVGCGVRWAATLDATRVPMATAPMAKAVSVIASLWERRIDGPVGWRYRCELPPVRIMAAQSARAPAAGSRDVLRVDVYIDRRIHRATSVAYSWCGLGQKERPVSLVSEEG